MKRTLSLLISAVIVIICLTPLTTVLAVQNSADANENGLLNKSNDYQLSNEQLNEPTDMLVDIVLSYPYLVDLFHSSGTKNDSYDLLKERFNGLAELEKREDALPVLRAKFQITDSDTIEAIFLERLISIYSKMFPSQELNTADDNSRSNVAFTVNDFDYVRSASDTETTSGRTVPLYTALSDYPSASKEIIANATAAAYGVTKLGNATSMYNCHSYAWYWASTSNESWVADAPIYVYDNHTSSVSTPKVGTIVVYFGADGMPAHSAVVVRTDGGNVICKSKWGADGLFEHEISNVPSIYKINGVPNITYYNYTTSHSCTIYIDDLSTHTRVCDICGWSSTERHIVNNFTMQCKICGLKGPFEVPFE